MIISMCKPSKVKGYDRLSNKLVLRWRDDDCIRQERTISDFKPYLYVNGKLMYHKETNYSPKYKVNDVRKELSASKIFWDTKLTENHSVDADGDNLWKIEFASPSDLKRFKNQYSGTREADVPYEDRWMIDNFKHNRKLKRSQVLHKRLLFIDLEALQFRGSPDEGKIWADNQEICVIGCYDSYTKKYIIWVQHKELGKLKQSNDYEIRDFSNEYAMLDDFVKWVDKIDPDILLAWGMGYYDLPTLWARLEATVGANLLSPSSMGELNRYFEPPSKWHKNRYKWTKQPIAGRLVISLDRLFQRIYYDSESTPLTSNKLDVVGHTMFGKGKTTFRPDFWDKDYHKFIDDYIKYNFRDVQLMVEIEERYNLVNNQLELQLLSPCSFESTFYVTTYAQAYFMRKANESLHTNFRQKTGWWVDGKNEGVEGATIFSPEKMRTVGVHKNVALLDFSGLYPSMMCAYNTSWETKVAKGLEKDDDIIGDSCRFRKNPEGILPKCVKELDKLRDMYKKTMKEAADRYGITSNEYKKWNVAQKTVKRLRASFYGLMLKPGFSWGDEDIGKTITYGGRKALKLITEESEKMGYKPIYGHTDSIFIALGDDLSPEECAKKAKELAEKLNTVVQTELDSIDVELETELIMDRFFLSKTNNYAGRIIWTPDKEHDIIKEDVENRIKMQGLITRKTSPMASKMIMDSLIAIFDDKKSSSIVDRFLETINNIRSGEISQEELYSRASLGMHLPTTRVLRALELEQIESGKGVKLDLLDLEGKPISASEMTGKTPVHYGAGAVKQDVRPDVKNPETKCYGKKYAGEQKAAAWYNIVLSNDSTSLPFEKDDSYYLTFAKDGPTWIPAGGYIAFADDEEVTEYEIDLDEIIEKHIIKKLKHIMDGLNLSLDVLRIQERRYIMDDFF